MAPRPHPRPRPCMHANFFQSLAQHRMQHNQLATLLKPHPRQLQLVHLLQQMNLSQPGCFLICKLKRLPRVMGPFWSLRSSSGAPKGPLRPYKLILLRQPSPLCAAIVILLFKLQCFQDHSNSLLGSEAYANEEAFVATVKYHIFSMQLHARFQAQ